MDRARAENSSGPALLAGESRVDQSVLFNREFEASAADNRATLQLASVKIGGYLHFDPGSIENNSPAGALLHIDGLTYSGVPTTGPDKDWLSIIKGWTRGYSAQPYQQLATAHRLSGHDTEARKILIAQRRDEASQADATLRMKVWAWVLRSTLGYGYKPGRALWWFAGVIAIALLLTKVLANMGGLAVTEPGGQISSCSVVEQTAVAIDMSVPLIDPGTSNRCHTTNEISGHILTAAGWLLQIFAWAFTTLFVAGFTGVVRKI